MADDDNIVPDDAGENDTVVITGDVDNAPDEVTNEGDTTVIVETAADDAPGGDAVEAVVIETAIDTAGRIAALEAEVAQLRNSVTIAEVQSEIALDAVDELQEADAAIVAATDEAIVETIEGAEIEDGGLGEDDEIVTDEIAPVSSRVHPWFRSWSDWKAGRG